MDGAKWNLRHHLVQHPHFIDGETEAQLEQGTHSTSCGWQGVDQASNPTLGSFHYTTLPLYDGQRPGSIQSWV